MKMAVRDGRDLRGVDAGGGERVRRAARADLVVVVQLVVAEPEASVEEEHATRMPEGVGDDDPGLACVLLAGRERELAHRQRVTSIAGFPLNPRTSARERFAGTGDHPVGDSNCAGAVGGEVESASEGSILSFSNPSAGIQESALQIGPDARIWPGVSVARDKLQSTRTA